MKPKTQKQALIKLLSKRWVGPILAFNEVGTIKLCTRVSELKKDFTIETRMVTKKSRFGFVCNFNEYRIIKDEYFNGGVKKYFKK